MITRIATFIYGSICYRSAQLTITTQRPNPLHSAFGRRHAMTFPYIIAFAATVLLTGAAPSWGTESAVASTPPRNLSETVPLYTNLGTHHKRISTRVPAAQQYFDQGLRFVYGFNHAEAIRSFTAITQIRKRGLQCHHANRLTIN
jgi:hypothetical protein